MSIQLHIMSLHCQKRFNLNISEGYIFSIIKHGDVSQLIHFFDTLLSVQKRRARPGHPDTCFRLGILHQFPSLGLNISHLRFLRFPKIRFCVNPSLKIRFLRCFFCSFYRILCSLTGILKGDGAFLFSAERQYEKSL